jgi:hypothetical protein
VVVTRDDLIVEGEPERFGFLLLRGGGAIYLNDHAAAAELGRRLADGMDPAGYAEVLVAFHPYSSATRAVLTEPDELRNLFHQASLPDVAPIRLQDSADGLTLTFSSYARYRWPGGPPRLDVVEWNVTVPAGQPASWQSRETATGLQLEDAS